MARITQLDIIEDWILQQKYETPQDCVKGCDQHFGKRITSQYLENILKIWSAAIW
tara:strand:+ start:2170 stop:2334 length:165 start_codon:yes stop_codon:yes gene_type:complete